jgi:hypothetical protein
VFARTPAQAHNALFDFFPTVKHDAVPLDWIARGTRGSARQVTDRFRPV